MMSKVIGLADPGNILKLTGNIHIGNSLRQLMTSAGYRAHGILIFVVCCAPVYARFPSGLLDPDSVVLPKNVYLLIGSTASFLRPPSTS